jgi:diaminopropionate ammonia-lyase
MSEVVVRNPSAAANDGAPDHAPIASTRAPLAFHQRLRGYAPTPLIDSPELAAALGVGRVLVKVEADRFGLPAFKILGASWATYRAMAKRLGHEPEWSTLPELAREIAALRPLTLVAATDGNHGRAVAAMARFIGLDARIFVPADMVAARVAGIASEGAAVEVVDGTYDDAVARAAATADDEHLVIADTSWRGDTETARHVIEGYATVFFEVDDAIARGAHEHPTVVFAPAGVGALAAAAVAHYRRDDDLPRPQLLSVEPIDAACVMASCIAGALTSVPGPHRSMMVGLNCGNASPVAWPTLARGLDWCVAIPDARAAQAMRTFAALGIATGETGAAALAGALAAAASAHAEQLGCTRDATVLLLCTEGVTDPANFEAVVRCAPEAITVPPSPR